MNIARNPHVPLDVLRELAQSDNFFVRRSAAANPALPVDILLTLSEDASRPPDHPERDRYWQERDLETIQEVATSNPSLPMDRLVALATQHPDYAAKNPAAPAFLLAHLAAHPASVIAVTQHPNTAADTLHQLAMASNLSVRRALAKRSPLAPTLLQRLAADEDWQVRSQVADRPDLSREFLTQLSQDPDPRVRERVAKNPATPAEIVR